MPLYNPPVTSNLLKIRTVLNTDPLIDWNFRADDDVLIANRNTPNSFGFNVPRNTSVAIPIGKKIILRNITDPAVSNDGGSVEVNSSFAVTTFFMTKGLPAQNALLFYLYLGQEATYIKIAVDQWIVTKYNILDSNDTWP